MPVHTHCNGTYCLLKDKMSTRHNFNVHFGQIMLEHRILILFSYSVDISCHLDPDLHIMTRAKNTILDRNHGKHQIYDVLMYEPCDKSR